MIVDTTRVHEGPVTFINVITLKPDAQGDVIDEIKAYAMELISKEPGYLSCNVYRSLDGRRVVTLTRWEKKENFEAIFTKPHILEAIRDRAMLHPADWHLYELSFGHSLT